MNLAAKLALGVACWGVAKGVLNEWRSVEEGWQTSPGSLYSCTLGPLTEEAIFRGVVDRAVGPVLGSVAFGIAHCSEEPAFPVQINAFRLADTTLIGGALSVICAHGGLPLAVLAHGAHNAGRWAVQSHFAKRRARS